MARRLSQPADLGALAGSADALAQAFVSLSSDIALVINEAGVITRVVQDGKAPMAPQANDWVGQRWSETVTGETRGKVERLLADVGSTGVARKRQVNHACAGTADLPVAYTAMRLGGAGGSGGGGAVLAVGRDLRTVAAIQQRFQDAQQELERSYWRARESEVRYRLLFQVATDAVFVVDSQTLRVREGNHAAQALLRAELGPLAGRVAEQQFDANSRPAVRALLKQALERGQAQEIHARLAGTHIPMSVAATPICITDAQNHGARTHVLLRVRASEPAAADTQPMHHPIGTPLARLVDTTAEGIVVTDHIGCVIVANRAFVQLVQAPALDQVQGHSLATWLGHGGLPGLLQSVRQQGMVQMAAQTLQGEAGAALDVDLTVTLLSDRDQECFGFTLRPVHPAASDQAAPLSAQTLALALAIDALCADVGQTPLGPLLARAEHLARGHLVHQALHRQAGGDATAAHELGISEHELARLRREHACEAAQPPS
jgi:transcriptional regulator PpsR